MHLLEGCDALRSAHMLPEAREKTLSLNNTTLKPDVRQTIFKKHFKIILLMTFLHQKTLRGLEKLVTSLRQKTLRGLITRCVFSKKKKKKIY